MRWHAPLLFCAAVAFFACAHVEAGSEPDSELNSPRCVTDVECGRDQRCFKEEKRPDGICAPKGATEADSAPTAKSSTPLPTKCKTAKDCPGKPCPKKMDGNLTSCVFCDTHAHACRSMTSAQ